MTGRVPFCVRTWFFGIRGKIGTSTSSAIGRFCLFLGILLFSLFRSYIQHYYLPIPFVIASNLSSFGACKPCSPCVQGSYKGTRKSITISLPLQQTESEKSQAASNLPLLTHHRELLLLSSDFLLPPSLIMCVLGKGHPVKRESAM